MEWNWQKKSLAEWRALLQRAYRSNWLQSPGYAKVSRLRDRKHTRLATILHEGEEVGLVAIQEIRLGPIHAVNLYRGPLWFCAHPPEEWLAGFAQLFARTYPKRLLRRRRWLPEWRDTGRAQEILGTSGFAALPESFATMWIDLTFSEAHLRAQLAQKWRNALNKGERQGLDLRLDTDGRSRELFLAYYSLDKFEKSYRGRDVNFVREEIEAASVLEELMIFWAYQQDQPIAAILVFGHGSSASYRVGWTTDLGRSTNAHNVLIWEAIRFLQLKGYQSFDVGGLVDDRKGGLDTFKQGLRGDEFRTPGLYC